MNVDVITNEPEKGKCIYKSTYKPFLWAKPDGLMNLFGGDRQRIKDIAHKNGISFKPLTINSDNKLPTHERLLNGYTILVEGYCSYSDFLKYFRMGGIDIFNTKHRENFLIF